MRLQTLGAAASIAMLLLMTAASGPAVSHDCYDVEILRIVDGDTVEASVQVWSNPAMTITSLLRIAGLDTPEKGGRASCLEESALSAWATAFSAGWANSDGGFLVCDMDRDKYGRMLGVLIRKSDGSVLADEMISRGFGREYDGGAKGSWCN